MTISMERARECVERPVIVEMEDGETKEGIIQYVGRSYIKVLVEGQEDGWVMKEEQLTWKPLLPGDTRSGIEGWFEDESTDDHWWVHESDTGNTLILSWRDLNDPAHRSWEDHVILSRQMEAVYQGHREASKWVAAEVQEIRGWAQP